MLGQLLLIKRQTNKVNQNHTVTFLTEKISFKYMKEMKRDEKPVLKLHHVLYPFVYGTVLQSSTPCEPYDLLLQ